MTVNEERAAYQVPTPSPLSAVETLSESLDLVLDNAERATDIASKYSRLSAIAALCVLCACVSSVVVLLLAASFAPALVTSSAWIPLGVAACFAGLALPVAYLRWPNVSVERRLGELSQHEEAVARQAATAKSAGLMSVDLRDNLRRTLDVISAKQRAMLLDPDTIRQVERIVEAEDSIGRRGDATRRSRRARTLERNL